LQIRSRMSATVSEHRVHGLRLTHAIARYGDRTARRAAGDDDVVRLHCSLRGEYSVRYPQLERRFDRLGPHHSVFYARPFELEFVNESSTLETFGIAIPVPQFVAYADGASDDVSRFCDRAASGHPGFLVEPSSPLPMVMEKEIRGMLESRYEGVLEQLHMLSRSIDLLVSVLDRASVMEGARFVSKKGDRDRLFAARDFVDARLTDPPGLRDVAVHVGLNEYKLKRGFRELFGTTVFAYLSERRLELEKKILLHTDKTAAVVAFELGYATPQHFSVAFTKRFGVSPKSVRKNP
jgi:AraC family transcriptional activator of pyochelin receptor